VRHRRISSIAPVVLTVVIGLLIGIGVTYVALRPDDQGASAFDGPPSVQTIDRPAGAVAHAAPSPDEILATAALASSTVASPTTEPSSARAALADFLTAEIEDRSDASFALLSPEAQRSFGSVGAWRQSRSDRVIPQRFTFVAERVVAGGGGDARTDITIRAERSPSITPFRGLVATQATERWALERTESGRWRLRRATASSTEPQLPPDGAARATAQRWVEQAAACADPATVLLPLQLARDLLGAVDLSGLACEVGGTWSASTAAVPVAELPDVTTFVAAFGPSVGRWGRGVAVTNGTRTMTVLLGPLGGEWRVMGLTSG
jgi:hypothetical protein